MAFDVSPPSTVRGILVLLAILVAAIAALYLSAGAFLVFAIILFGGLAIAYALGIRVFARLSGGSW